MNGNKFLIVLASLVVVLIIVAGCATPTVAPTAKPVEPTKAPAVAEPTKAPVSSAPASSSAPAPTKAPEPTKATASSTGPSLQGAKLTLLIHPTLFGAAGGATGIVKEFEQQTGATVEVVTAPIGEHTQKALVEFLSGSGRYDVIAMQNSDLSTQFTPYFLPLDKYVEKDAKAWEWDDIIPSISALAKIDGKQLGIPYRWGAFMLYYRTDLFQAAGLQPPKNFEETLAAAKKLTKVTGDPKTDIYGFVLRGKPPEELAQDWLSLFYAAGGDLLTKDNKCNLNTPQGTKTTTFLRDLYAAQLLPKDYFAWGRDDYITAMQQGRVASGLYWTAYWGNLVNKDSTVAGKLGWALSPSEAGVTPGRSRGAGWFLTINKFSKNPDAAWELVKALTSKPNSIREAVQWANGPIRTSTFAAKEYQDLFPVAKDWVTSFAAAGAEPPHPAVPKFFEVMSEELTNMINGKTPINTGLESLCKRIDKIVADTK